MDGAFKRLSAIIIIISLLSLFLTGCEQTNGSTPSGEVSTATFTIGSGEKSTPYYAVNDAMTQIGAPINLAVVETAGSIENIDMMQNNTAQMGMVQNAAWKYAEEGNKNIQGLNVIMALYPETVHLVVPAESKVKSVMDLVGKRVAIGAEGSGVYISALNLFKAFDIPLSTMETSKLGFKQSCDALKNDEVDAFFIVSAIPNGLITALAKEKPIKMVNINGPKVDEMIAENPGYKRTLIPKELYGLEEDTETVSVYVTLACRADLDENTVYEFTKYFYKNIDKMKELTPFAKQISMSECKNGVTVPIHPGALRYYNEQHIN